MTDKQILLSFIKNHCKGHENAKTGAYLRVMFNYSNIREVQETIEILRHEGHVILSNDGEGVKGYFIPTSFKEGLPYLSSIRSRGMKTLQTYRILLDLLAKEYIKEA